MLKIAAVSDTHGTHWNINLAEPVDLLIHAGDATGSDYSLEAAKDFMEWLDGQPAREKLFVPGNHDGFFSRPGWEAAVPPGVHVLIEGALELFDGKLKIYGSAITPEFCGWYLMRDRDRLIQDWKEAAPTILEQLGGRVDILVCHGPPYGILDENDMGEKCGCEGLRDALDVLKPRLGIFGHIHEAQGKLVLHDRSLCVNVSYLDEYYTARGKVFTIDLTAS